MGGHHTKGSGGHRGRPYGMMLLVAFGAALLGVMALHKFRERRIFNMLLKDKDTELYSLNLLLQKERDHSKEMKEKTEEMKSKIYTLRSKKMELDNRILEMQSMISSLKEEHRTMETALEEKQEEVKILREKEIDAGTKEQSQDNSSLAEILKQKDSEIEDLKRRLEGQVKVWSVSSDDPSNTSTTNATNTNKDDEKIVAKDSEEKKNEATVVVEESKENARREVNETKKINGDSANEDKNEVKDDDDAKGKSESSEVLQLRRKGRKWRDLVRKRKLERNRSSATRKHRAAEEDGVEVKVNRRGSRSEEDKQMLIKPIYESDSGKRKEIEVENISINGDDISKAKVEVLESNSAEDEEKEEETDEAEF